MNAHPLFDTIPPTQHSDSNPGAIRQHQRRLSVGGDHAVPGSAHPRSHLRISSHPAFRRVTSPGLDRGAQRAGAAFSGADPEAARALGRFVKLGLGIIGVALFVAGWVIFSWLATGCATLEQAERAGFDTGRCIAEREGGCGLAALLVCAPPFGSASAAAGAGAGGQSEGQGEGQAGVTGGAADAWERWGACLGLHATACTAQAVSGCLEQAERAAKAARASSLHPPGAGGGP